MDNAVVTPLGYVITGGQSRETNLLERDGERWVRFVYPNFPDAVDVNLAEILREDGNGSLPGRSWSVGAPVDVELSEDQLAWLQAAVKAHLAEAVKLEATPRGRLSPLAEPV